MIQLRAKKYEIILRCQLFNQILAVERSVKIARHELVGHYLCGHRVL